MYCTEVGKAVTNVAKATGLANSDTAANTAKIFTKAKSRKVL